MSTTRLVSSYLRRRTNFSLLRTFSLLNPNHPSPSPSPCTTSFRHFSSDSDSTHETDSVTESVTRKLGFINGSDVSAMDIASDSILEDSIFPIRGVVSLLDGYHDLSGLPWWIVIVSSTVALRVALLPLIIKQLQKLKQIGEIFPKLPPPPLPPPFSNKRFVDQVSHFRKQQKALGCPSFLWFFASHTVQIPSFILLMVSIRRMALSDFPGFDTGGILWFQDLTESSSGLHGCIFPFLVAGLHFCNVQISLRGSSIDEQKGLLQLLIKWYRKYLQILTIPIGLAAFYVPQGSLVYWATNGSLTLIQQVCFQNPNFRVKLGLMDQKALQEEDFNVTVDDPVEKGLVSAFDLPPLELVHLSVSYLSTGKIEKAIRLLRVAVEKDPDCYKAWTILGDVMVVKGLFYEASEYAESAISKICQLGEPRDAEAVDFLIQASIIAGGAFYRQGKIGEAIVHFERVRDMEEPEDPAAKSRYYEGLVVFASVLINEGRKDEAVKYLRMAVAFDPQYSVILENLNLEKDANDFLGDLASSRRADY